MLLMKSTRHSFLFNSALTLTLLVAAASFKGSSGSFAKLFDGTEKVPSWDNILGISRSDSLR